MIKGFCLSLDYGVIGNCRTVALVKRDTSIDWLCLPRFDSPSIFSRLLDDESGSSFKIIPVGEYEIKQAYIENTNVIKTTFFNSEAEFDVIDYFPYYNKGNVILRNSEVHRILIRKRGSPIVRILINPKMEYGKYAPNKTIEGNKLSFSYKATNVYIYSDLGLKELSESSEISLPEKSYVLLAYNKLKYSTNINYIMKEMENTVDYWRSWSDKVKGSKKYRLINVRSALVLRLLTYEDTGAIVAAGTTSIPEIKGSVRNWDYRYSWVRDSSFTVQALIRLGLIQSAYDFVKWLNMIYAEHGVSLQALFKVNGSDYISESTLSNLKGYGGSKPIRIGNEAYKQRQVDIIGELLNSLYLFYLKHNASPELGEISWDLIYGFVETAIKEWTEKDHSIWEFRGTNKHYTFSKVMCWVAVDRGIKIARRLGYSDVIGRWSKARDEIKASVMKRGWNSKMHAFTQYYGSNNLDASLLLMPAFGIISWRDKKMLSTIEAIGRDLVRGPFVMRYTSKDEFGMPKSAFIACSFWFIDALYHTGKKKEALNMFKHIILFQNHMGLLSEDINTDTQELLGNFPQAYSHIAMINTITNLFKVKKKNDKPV
ncbi:MAG: glycoside hydrolase family 15 protein [Candidatus Micrarchaeaceae archaeon]